MTGASSLEARGGREGLWWRHNGQVMLLLAEMTAQRRPYPDYAEIACQQILEADHSVFSIQWIVVPPGAPGSMDGARLLEMYLRHIRRCTLSLVRPAMGNDCLEFRLGSSAVSLISLSPPIHATTPDGSRSTLRICGGVLVQSRERERGRMVFQVERLENGSRITIQLSDFCPLILGSSRPSHWRKWLYRLTQAYIHKVVTVRFLAMVYGQLTGRKPETRVVKVALRSGKAT